MDRVDKIEAAAMALQKGAQESAVAARRLVKSTERAEIALAAFQEQMRRATVLSYVAAASAAAAAGFGITYLVLR